MSFELPLQEAIDDYHQGKTELALEKMQNILLEFPTTPIIRIEFANILMREKRFDDARELLQSLSSEDQKQPSALALLGQLDSINAVIDAPEFEDLLNTVEQDPSDCLAREQLSAHFRLRGDYVSAMDQLLEIVRRDRNYNNDVGRTELLKIFELLAEDNTIIGQYRRKLALALN